MKRKGRVLDIVEWMDNEGNIVELEVLLEGTTATRHYTVENGRIVRKDK